VVNNYPPHLGGVERHVASLAQTLVAGGDRATVLVLDDSIGTSIVNGVTVIRIAQWLRVASVISFPRPGASRKILPILASLNVSAISTHTRFFPMSFVGIRLARKLGIAAIHTEHGSGFVRGVSLPIAIASRLIDITVGRYVLRSATAVLAVSEAVSEFVDHLSGASAQVFYNAITLNQWPHRPANQAETRFLFVGRLVPGKGWDAALEAAAWLATQHPLFRFSLDIVGDGPSADQVAALVAKLELQKIVTLHGQVAAHELSEIMGGAILVNPTTLAEGFQTSLVEAIATGCSVVTYAVPGAQLLLDDGAPVSIVSDHSTETLAADMIFAAQYPLPPYSAEKMAQWDWSTRAKQYLALVDAAQNTPVQNRASRINKTRQRQK
jgi:glycosyltransferase involved in cell wall biosynthesis